MAGPVVKCETCGTWTQDGYDANKTVHVHIEEQPKDDEVVMNEDYPTCRPSKWWDRYGYDVRSTVRRTVLLGGLWLWSFSLLDIAHHWWK